MLYASAVPLLALAVLGRTKSLGPQGWAGVPLPLFEWLEGVHSVPHMAGEGQKEIFVWKVFGSFTVGGLATRRRPPLCLEPFINWVFV